MGSLKEALDPGFAFMEHISLRGLECRIYVVMVVFSHSVMSDSLRPHELQHAWLPCPSLSSRICSNSCPLSWWCHPTISSSVTPFSSCLQSFPALGSFLVSQLFASGGQGIGASASSSVLPMNIQGWFSLGWTGFIPLSKALSRVFSIPQFEVTNSLALSLLYCPALTSIHDYWKNHHFDYKDLSTSSIFSWLYPPGACPSSLPLLPPQSPILLVLWQGAELVSWFLGLEEGIPTLNCSFTTLNPSSLFQLQPAPSFPYHEVTHFVLFIVLKIYLFIHLFLKIYYLTTSLWLCLGFL